jgi:hypothetical protein
VREIIIDGHDAEEAVCRANIDLFTPRDTSELVCAHLGRWTASGRWFERAEFELHKRPAIREDGPVMRLHPKVFGSKNENGLGQVRTASG